MTVNMHEAKSQLSRLVEDVEQHGKTIIIARNGKPAALLTPLSHPPQTRLGLAKGKFTVPESIDEAPEEILKLFGIEGP